MKKLKMKEHESYTKRGNRVKKERKKKAPEIGAKVREVAMSECERERERERSQCADKPKLWVICRP